MAERPDTRVAAGTWGDVRYARRLNGCRPAKEFYESCSQKNRAKLNSLFQWIANQGSIPNWEKFHQVEGDIFELKSHLIRISCYRAGFCWFLLHGFIKKSKYWPPGDLQHAQ